MAQSCPYTNGNMTDEQWASLYSQQPANYPAVLEALQGNPQARDRSVQSQITTRGPSTVKAALERQPTVDVSQGRLKQLNDATEYLKKDIKDSNSIRIRNGKTYPLFTRNEIFKIKQENNPVSRRFYRNYMEEYFRIRYDEIRNEKDLKDFRQELRDFGLFLSLDPARAGEDLRIINDRKVIDVYGEINLATQFLRDMTGMTFDVDHILPAVPMKGMFKDEQTGSLSDNWRQNFRDYFDRAWNTPIAMKENLSALLGGMNKTKSNKGWAEDTTRSINAFNNLFGTAYRAQELGSLSQKQAQEEQFVQTLAMSMKNRGLSFSGTGLQNYLHNNYGLSPKMAQLLVKSLNKMKNKSLLRMKSRGTISF